VVEALLRIGETTYTKTGHGVFKVPFERLGTLRFNDVPYYSTVEVDDLPGDLDSYELVVSATHGGGPTNEDFTIFVHVHCIVRGDARDPATRRTCERKADRVRRVLRPLVDDGILDDSDGGNDHRTYFGEERWLVDILYTASFTRDANPELATFIHPVAERFAELLRTPDQLLFLCHASEDKDFVDWLANRLDAQAVNIWYDRREIRAGDSIVERIGDGLAGASHVVVVLSKAANRKPWVRREFSSALMRQLSDASVRVIPVLREPCDLPQLLSDIRYADFGLDREAGFAALIEAIGV
jgi:TIR domain